MKKSILILSLFVFVLQLTAQEPQVKFYLVDGTSKIYNLSDVDSIGVIDKQNNYVMRIHYNTTLIAYYPTEIIGSLKFEKDSSNKDIFNVYIFSFPKSYLISGIDSIILYQDIYQPLTIGTQVWMLKNLDVDHYRNSDSILQVTDSTQWANSTTGAWCYYDNDANKGITYGKLYNWYAVNDSRSLAPSGWHVPSDAEWTTLTTFLGDESVAGGKLKEVGIAHWLSPNKGATNESGFSALPGSCRTVYGVFDLVGSNGYWWTSAEGNAASAWIRNLNFINSSISRGSSVGESGFSVRCVRD